jgi:hypothetical protein
MTEEYTKIQTQQAGRTHAPDPGPTGERGREEAECNRSVGGPDPGLQDRCRNRVVELSARTGTSSARADNQSTNLEARVCALRPEEGEERLTLDSWLNYNRRQQ